MRTQDSLDLDTSAIPQERCNVATNKQTTFGMFYQSTKVDEFHIKMYYLCMKNALIKNCNSNLNIYET